MSGNRIGRFGVSGYSAGGRAMWKAVRTGSQHIDEVYAFDTAGSGGPEPVSEVVLRPFPWSPAPAQAKEQAGLEPLAFLGVTAPARKPEVPPLPFAGSAPAPARAPLEPSLSMGMTSAVTDPKPRAATPFEPAPTAARSGAPSPPLVVPSPPPTRAAPPVPPPAARGALEPVEGLGRTAVALPSAQPAVPFQRSAPAPPRSSALGPDAALGMASPAKPSSGPAVPFQEASSAPPGTAVESALEPAASLGMTAAAKPSSRPAVPFHPGGGAASPPVAHALEESAAMGGTVIVRPSEPRVSDRRGASARPPVPEDKVYAPGGSVIASAATSHGAPSSARGSHATVLEEVAAIGETAATSARPTGPSLPFQGKNPAPRRVVDALEPSREMGQTAPTTPRHGRAAAADPSASDPLAQRVERQATASPAVWSPEDYGRFCAALDAAGDRHYAVLGDWGVRSESQCQHLHKVWSERMAADPAVAARAAAARHQR